MSSKKALPCDNCEFRQGESFCQLLPWNDRELDTPLEKYIAWQGRPCPHAREAPIERSALLLLMGG